MSDTIDNEILRVYHGSHMVVEHPELRYSRRDVDFGAGFYLTQDETMARKWASNKSPSVLNVYSLDLTSLRVKRLQADEEWFSYVMFHRLGEQTVCPFVEEKYDVIMGPTANDKLFIILDMYVDGLVSMKNAIRVVNCMNYSDQITIKHQEIMDTHLKFESSKELFGQERDMMRKRFRDDSKLANDRTRAILREINGE